MIEQKSTKSKSAKVTPHSSHKRGRPRKAEELQTYLIHVERFEPSYSFSLNSEKMGSAYYEFAHNKIYGRLISPELLNVTQVEIVVMATRSMDDECCSTNSSHTPLAIGSIDLLSDTLRVVLELPFLAVSMLVPALVAGQVAVIAVHGKKLKYRRGLINGINFDGKYCPEDYQ